MKKIRAVLRGLGMTFLMITHVVPALVKSLVSSRYLPLALRMRRLWARRSLWLLGVRIDRSGQLPAGGPYLYVGNHRSYVDPIVTLTEVEALPVAKAEVGAWPLIGKAAKATGIMYVERENKHSRISTLEAMRQTLLDGYSVLVYPEGTTHTEPVTRPFKRGAFTLAAQEGIGIVPMAIEYKYDSDAWVGNDTFLPHFLRCFGKKRTPVRICYGDPIWSEDPKQLVTACKTWIDSTLLELRRAYDKTDKTVEVD